QSGVLPRPSSCGRAPVPWRCLLLAACCCCCHGHQFDSSRGASWLEPTNGSPDCRQPRLRLSAFPPFRLATTSFACY
ncbi:hypothetical protein E4U54_006430, partial [Claviceps lovelessii]